MSNLHGINQWSLTLEAVDSPAADLVQEAVKGNAEHQNLQHLLEVNYVSVMARKITDRVHVTHVAGVDKATGLNV